MNTGLRQYITKRWKIVVLALLLAVAATAGVPAADAALPTGFVPAAQADGPQRDGGG